MSKIAIAIHGGAGRETSYLKQHRKEIEAGMEEALRKGYQVLKKGLSALRAAEAAVIVLEDNPLFNAGRGSTLNKNGEVEMDAAIMDGKSFNAGAVSIVRRIKNPISLARLVMEKTKHVLISGNGALEFAKSQNVALKQNSYFITQHQIEEFQKTNKQKKSHGTVGAVTLDKNGNVAAATSTGGTHYAMPGRVGDSCIIGAGCYANNRTCAISSTGEGEYIIKGVVAHTISMMIELKHLSLQKACDHVIHHRTPACKGEMGVIALDANGQIYFSFNTEIMPRGMIDINGNLEIKI